MLDVRITCKAYRAATRPSLEVLRDVRFTMSRGEIGVLVGPSGCGKTTMLRVIAGLDTDYEGTIDFSGRGKLAMVFQEPRLLLWRTVEDNVRLVAPGADEATLALLFDVLELNQHRLHYPGQLSLGLARRVALARAFAVKPDLLLLDEPFVSLDDALAARLGEELVRLVEKRSVTTLMVTHNADEAARLADRLFLLSPRPARVIAELPITALRASRTTGDIAAIKSEVVRRLEASLAPRRCLGAKAHMTPLIDNCDGVLVDSEQLGGEPLAELMIRLGDAAIQRPEPQRRVGAGEALPEELGREAAERLLAHFRSELRPVAGAA